ncbi:MAG: hypothetical protein IPG71_01850 [bacterium]|nr:hypothetical protein [bacterium]
MSKNHFMRNVGLLFCLLSLAITAQARNKPQTPTNSESSGTPSQLSAEAAVHLGHGGLRYTIQVRKFEDLTPIKFIPPQGLGWILGGAAGGHMEDKGDLGSALASLLGDALESSGRFIVIADQEMRSEILAEQEETVGSDRFAQGAKGPQKGRMSTAQLLVRGKLLGITENAKQKSSGFDLGQLKIGGGKSELAIELAIEVYNSTTGQVVANEVIKGISNKKDSKLRIGPWEQREKSGDTFMQAAQNAILSGVDLIMSNLDGILWLGNVVLVKDDEIALNRGLREGLTVGQRLDVGSADELIDPDTGETLDWSLNRVGTLEVVRLAEKVAYCRAIDTTRPIEKGMTVTPERN